MRTGEGEEVGCARGLDAGQRLYPFHRVTEEVNPLVVAVILPHGYADPHRQQVLRIEARINRLQAPEAPDEQPRAHQQDERERDLHDHEGAAQPVTALAAADVLAAFL